MQIKRDRRGTRGIAQGESLAERYERTMCRIQEAGYEVKTEWECAWYKARIVEQKPEHLTQPIVKHTPQKTRDAQDGGGTEIMCLNY